MIGSTFIKKLLVLLAMSLLVASKLPSRASNGIAREFTAIRDIPILRATDGLATKVTSLWSPQERAILICFRSFG